MQMLLAALSRRMSCSRARIVITKARWPSRSVVMPTSRPGIWRTSASVEARRPRYGPPYCGGMPERLALAGGDVGPVGAGRGEDGEADRLDDGDEQGARGVRELADRRHRLEQAEEVGLGGDDAGDRVDPASASIRSRAARSVVPAASPSPTRGISSSSRPPPKYVRSVSR